MLKTMINATIALSILIASTAHAGWVLTGATFHSCYLGEAVRAGYCAVGGEHEVQPEFITEPKPPLPYNKITQFEDGQFHVATEIAVSRTYSKWGQERTKITAYRFSDLLTLLDRVPEETIWDADVWLVADAYGREFEIQKNTSPDNCTLWLRGEWRQIRPWARDPFTDATLTYTHTDCED